MADTGDANTDDTATPQAGNPRVGLLAQYLKDCSYENPKAPGSLSKDLPPATIDVSLDVQVQRLGPSRYEVALRTTANGKRGEDPVFVAEVVFAGVFELFDIPEEQIQPVCLVECPRLLFPFARRILSDLTRDGGVPPILLDPVDFGALYENQKAQAQANAAGETIN
jgi:preprotein translocase subunit SecB